MGTAVGLAKVARTIKRTSGDNARGIPAGEGIALLDGNFQRLAISDEAEVILDTIGGSSGESDEASLSPNLLNLLNTRNKSDGTPLFLTAHGREYSCRVFELKPWSDDIVPPVTALYFRQEKSVMETVFQVSEEYHLTDREQEALIGVAMGLSSKELAVRMNISPNTVKAFLRLVKIKMGSSTRAGIVGKLIDKGGRMALRGSGKQ